MFLLEDFQGIPMIKNLQLLDGKPLLAWSIEMGQSLSEVEQVFVSTEDAEIAEVAYFWCGSDKTSRRLNPR